jgi:hypothetical protein
MNFYETSDMGTIAVLELYKFPIREIRGDRKKVAVFDKTPELEEIVNSFNLGSLEGNLFEFNEQLRKTKYKILNAI